MIITLKRKYLKVKEVNVDAKSHIPTCKLEKLRNHDSGIPFQGIFHYKMFF